MDYTICTLDTHFYDDKRYTLLLLSIYYLHSLYVCALGTHCKDDPGYSLLLPIYIIIVFIILCVTWINNVMMTQGIHCCYLSIYYLYSLYLIYLGYTLL